MTNQVNEIEVTLKEMNDAIALAEDLEKLHNNRAFKKIILEGFFKEHVTNLAPGLAHPLPEMQREQLVRQLEAVGGLQAYFSGIYRKAEEAAASIEEYEAAQAEIMSEV